MIIVLKPGSTEEQATEIQKQIADQGLKPLYMPGSERVVLGALGDERVLAGLHLENHPAVERVTPILAPYKAVSREFKPESTVVDIGQGVLVGGDQFTVIAGPCAVESHEQLDATAAAIKEAGASALRGGAYKPRTSPYSFQGLGVAGLEILAEVSQKHGLPAVTEVIDVHDVAVVADHVDVLQVGARNMQNYRLLRELGTCGKPVLLKRGMAAGIVDLMLAAEYIVSEGNPNVILCERGIKTFETVTRNTLDLNAVPYIKAKSHLPIVADPSHGTGIRELVAPMTMASAACGADGAIIEVHHDPRQALSDGHQSLPPEDFVRLLEVLRPVVEAVGKRL